MIVIVSIKLIEGNTTPSPHYYKSTVFNLSNLVEITSTKFVFNSDHQFQRRIVLKSFVSVAMATIVLNDHIFVLAISEEDIVLDLLHKV